MNKLGPAIKIEALSDYIFYSRYARYNKKSERIETLDEAVSRVFEMHRTKQVCSS